MTEHSDKIRKSIIERYKKTGMTDDDAWQSYLGERYHTPKARENQLKAARAGGKKSTNRPFTDPRKASEASIKRHYGKKER